MSNIKKEEYRSLLNKYKSKIEKQLDGSISVRGDTLDARIPETKN